MEGIVDRFEEDRVVVEVGEKMLIFKREIFPENLEEGDRVVFKEGRFTIDEEGTRKRKESIDSLFNSLINKED